MVRKELVRRDGQRVISRTTHEMLKHVAREMAGTAYDHMAHNNRWYRLFGSQDAFVERCWPLFLDDVRSTLTDMLIRNDVTEQQRHEIYVALLSDKAVNGMAIEQPQ